ncbi:MAG: NfeD family protein [Pirellulales bacterium]
MALRRNNGFNALRVFGRLILFGLSWLTIGLLLRTAAAQDGAPATPGPPAAEVAAQPAPAAETTAAFGRLIRVPLPIVGELDNRVRAMVRQALSTRTPAEGRPVLVFELWPEGSEFGQGCDFYRAQALADFLTSRELSGVRTVAYIPKSIKGHGVLVALACEEIVMAPDAALGEAGVDLQAGGASLEEAEAAYRKVASRRKTLPVEVALGMLDRNRKVLEVETDLSVEYVFDSDLADLRVRRAVQGEPKTLKERGELGSFTGREARRLGFVKYEAPSRDALARALGLPAAALEQDPSLGGKWVSILVPIKGPITPQLAQHVPRKIMEQIETRGVNLVCLQIESPGGSLNDSLELANFLADLDPQRVRTVAFVPEQALGDATAIALACDQIVLQPKAALGGWGAHQLSADEVKLVSETIRRKLAPAKNRSWSLPAALVDPMLEVHRYQKRDGKTTDYFSADEFAELKDQADWQRGDVVTKPGEPLQAVGPRAVELGLARQVVANFGEWKQLYGLEDDPNLVQPGWADVLISALTRTEVAWMLLLIGGVALYVELQAPGLGIGAFVATVCFLLFFWAKFLGGTAEWLEVMLFVAGVVCLLLELFVLPGLGIFGLGGGLLIITSLVLLSQTFVLPRNEYQMDQFRDSLLVVGGALLGIIGAAVAVRRYLPHAPLLRNIMLAPDSDEELERISSRESLVDFSHLLGQHGSAITPLMPSGKARFGGELVDVISSGEAIDRGDDVVVVQVRGNHVVVEKRAV